MPRRVVSVMSASLCSFSWAPIVAVALRRHHKWSQPPLVGKRVVELTVLQRARRILALFEYLKSGLYRKLLMHTQTADVSALLYACAALLTIGTKVVWYDSRAVGSLVMAS